MSPFFEQHIKELQEANTNAYIHPMQVAIDENIFLDTILSNWGACVKKSSAAPLFSKLSEFKNVFKSSMATLNFSISEKDTGVLEHFFSDEQKEEFKFLEEILVEAAQKAKIEPQVIAQAQEQLKSFVDSFEIRQSFAPGESKELLESLIAKYGTSFKFIEHSKVGRLDDKALESLKTTRPYTEQEVETKIEQQKQNPAKGVAKYKNYVAIIKEDDAESLREGIEASQKMELWGDEKNTAAQLWVFVAMEFNAKKCLEVLLDLCPVELDARHENGIQPIHFAALHNKPEMIEFLVNKGIDVQATSVDGLTPLMVAASMNSVDAIAKLHELGADLDYQTLDGKTALHLAATGGDDEKTAQKSIEKLLELGANPALREHMEDALPEDFIDADSDLQYAALVEARKRWENGDKTPKQIGIVAKTRATLGI